MWKFANKTFEEIHPRLNWTGERIGNNSAYGEVYAIEYRGNKQRYVVKYVWFGRPPKSGNSHKQLYDDAVRRKQIFDNEVKVGTIPGINKVTPKLHAWQYIAPSQYRPFGGGAMILDNFLMGWGGETMSLHKYMTTYYKNACLPADHKVYQLLRDKLDYLYRKVKVFHGDLHTENIQVVMESLPPPNAAVKKPPEIFDLFVFDFGASRKLNSPHEGCFRDLLNVVNHAFHAGNGNIDPLFPTGYPVGSGALIKQANGQPFRSNKKLLEHFGLYEGLKKR